METVNANKSIPRQLYNNLILYPKGMSQMSKTILAPFTHARNFLSATAFAAANGILPFGNTRDVKAAWNALQVTVPGARKSNEYYQELLDLGVVNSQVQLGDVKNLLRDVRFGENLNVAKPFESMLKKLTAGTGRIAKGFMKGEEDLYTAEDDLFKIANFAIERYRLKNAYTAAKRNFTDDLLDQQAAAIVRNTVPNYA